MHDSSFSDAVNPAEISVLSLRLAPYSIGHEVLLLNIRSPFVLMSESEFNSLPSGQQILALRRAVLICSQSWSENHKPQRWLKLWHWWTRNADYPLAIAEFRNYLNQGHYFFPHVDTTGPGDNYPDVDTVLNGKRDSESNRTYGGPFIARLYTFALTLKHPGCVWDISYSLLACLYVVKSETEGGYRIENFDEMEQREHSWKDHAEWKSEKEAEKNIVKLEPGLATPLPDLS